MQLSRLLLTLQSCPPTIKYAYAFCIHMYPNASIKSLHVHASLTIYMLCRKCGYYGSVYCFFVVQSHWSHSWAPWWWRAEDCYAKDCTEECQHPSTTRKRVQQYMVTWVFSKWEYMQLVQNPTWRTWARPWIQFQCILVNKSEDASSKGMD